MVTRSIVVGLNCWAGDKYRREGEMIGYEKEMYGRLIKGIAKADGVSLTELSERIGISRQALYKRLEGGMKVESFVECLEAMGYSLYYGREGKVRKIE